MSRQGLTAGLAEAVRTSQPEHSIDAMREAKKDYSTLQPLHSQEEKIKEFKSSSA